VVTGVEQVFVRFRSGPLPHPGVQKDQIRNGSRPEIVLCPARALNGRALAPRAHHSNSSLCCVDRRGQQGSTIALIEACQVSPSRPAAAVVSRSMTSSTRRTSPIANAHEQLLTTVRGLEWCDLTLRMRTHGRIRTNAPSVAWIAAGKTLASKLIIISSYTSGNA
jgi:hypothetical protein